MAGSRCCHLLINLDWMTAFLADTSLYGVLKYLLVCNMLTIWFDTINYPDDMFTHLFSSVILAIRAAWLYQRCGQMRPCLHISLFLFKALYMWKHISFVVLVHAHKSWPNVNIYYFMQTLHLFTYIQHTLICSTMFIIMLVALPELVN